jgi:acetate kinase
MNVLVLNCGSSSVKFQVIHTDIEIMGTPQEKMLAKGLVDRIGESVSSLSFEVPERKPVIENTHIPEHRKALEWILRIITHPEQGVLKDTSEINAVGHRFVHGGEEFTGSVLVTKAVLDMMHKCIELAPLHNPPNLKGYEVSYELLPGVPHVAVFDTTFHQTMPAYAYIYGLPYGYYEKYKIRRYGFHGTSHRYVSKRAAELLNRPYEELKIITCHLGNGSSITAIDKGKSVDTSMGFTPLEGVLMGTRCGDLDPAILLFLMEQERLTLKELKDVLNKKSGLLGISGLSNDMRDIERESQNNSFRAKLAFDVFCYRIKKYIAAYTGILGGLDVVVFTAGIGENSPWVRARCCENLSFMGIKLDERLNQEMNCKEGDISAPDSRVRIMLIPTKEELTIARDAVYVVRANHLQAAQCKM